LAVKASLADILREAVKDQHSNETFEKAVGRIVRRNEGSFQEYLKVIGRVRERAARDGKGLVAAATMFVKEGAD
jgi:hypothetical protein